MYIVVLNVYCFKGYIVRLHSPIDEENMQLGKKDHNNDEGTKDQTDTDMTKK